MTWKPNEANAKHDRIHTQALSESGPQQDGTELWSQRPPRAARAGRGWCWGPADLAQHVKERAEENTWFSTWTGVQIVEDKGSQPWSAMAGGSWSAMRTAQEGLEQATSRDVRRDGQSLHETARKRGLAVGSRRYEEREERTTAGERRADAQRVRKGKTAGKNLQGRLAAASRSRRSSFRRGSQARDGGGSNEDQHSLRRVEARVHGAGD